MRFLIFFFFIKFEKKNSGMTLLIYFQHTLLIKKYTQIKKSEK